MHFNTVFNGTMHHLSLKERIVLINKKKEQRNSFIKCLRMPLLYNHQKRKCEYFRGTFIVLKGTFVGQGKSQQCDFVF